MDRVISELCYTETILQRNDPVLQGDTFTKEL